MRVMLVDGSRIEYNVFPAIVRSIGVHRHVRAHAVPALRMRAARPHALVPIAR
jgi:hypothetical protein